MENRRKPQSIKWKSLAAELAEAVKFALMPVTTPKDQLNVDRLLATMAEDNERLSEALAKYEAIKKGGE